jgi:hypothetical protein
MQAIHQRDFCILSNQTTPRIQHDPPRHSARASSISDLRRLLLRPQPPFRRDLAIHLFAHLLTELLDPLDVVAYQTDVDALVQVRVCT